MKENDLIEFSNIKGENYDFLIGKQYRVKSTSYNDFTIINIDKSEVSRNLLDKLHFINGKLIKIREPTTFNHNSLSKQLATTIYDVHGFDSIYDQKLIDLLNTSDKFRNKNILRGLNKWIVIFLHLINLELKIMIKL